jgi:hypothetical protein
LGFIGDAQVGPIYFGTTGMASLIRGFIAIEIIGLTCGPRSTGVRSSSSANCRGWHWNRRRPLTDCTSRRWRKAAGG